ncbi:MAG: ATP-binding protein [Ignavibacteriaceae bacterium]|nr:ATP-binding protein [Ignavibacteriaceae bacterium]
MNLLYQPFDYTTIEFILDRNGVIISLKRPIDSFFNLSEGQVKGKNISAYLNNNKERNKLLKVFDKLSINPESEQTICLFFTFDKLHILTSSKFSIMKSISGENSILLKLQLLKELSKQEQDKLTPVENIVPAQKNDYPDITPDIANNCPLPYMVEVEGKILAANSAFIRLIGLEGFEELNNISIWEHIEIISNENRKGRFYINSFNGKNFISHFYSQDINYCNQEAIVYYFISFSEEIFTPAELFNSLVGPINHLPVILLNPALEIVQINDRSKEITGFTREELANKPVASLLNKESAFQFAEKIKSYSKNQSVLFEIEIIDKKGEILIFNSSILRLQNILYGNDFYLLILNQEIKDGKTAFHDGISQLIETKNAELNETNIKLQNEITWRKEAEEELRVKDERLDLALEVSEEGLWDFNIISGNIYTNQKFCEIFGFNKYDYSSASLDIKKLEGMIADIDRQHFKEAMEKHFSGGTANFNLEHRIKTMDNGLKWVSTKGKVVLRDNHNNPVRFIGRVEDISLRKIAEEEIKNSYQKAKELAEVKSRFVTMVSHEFRTPLSTILSSSELLHTFGNELNSEESEKQFNRIEKSVDNLTELLNDILTMNRNDGEVQVVNKEEIEIISLCKQFTEEVRNFYKQAPLILFNSNVLQYTLQSDKKLLRQILINLLNNAIKYNQGQNAIKIAIEIDTHVLISIEDNGIGIRQEDHVNLFDPFFRGSNTSGIPGTGLGTSIVKNSVVLLGGEIWFESKLGIGTKFYIKFPITNDK